MRDSGPPPPSPPPMNSLRRMLAVLKLIQPYRPTVDIAQICLQLGYAPATAYRYVRELADVGLLVRLPGGYALGPRIIELDLLIRETDQRDTALTNNSGTVKSNPDGSVDIYFGPKAPAGKASNWVQTTPGKGWFTILRLYGALEPWFDKTWRPGEIELVK